MTTANGWSGQTEAGLLEFPGEGPREKEKEIHHAGRREEMPHLRQYGVSMSCKRETFNPSTQEAEAGRSLLEASLVSMVNSRTARAVKRDPVSQKVIVSLNLVLF